MNLTTPEGVKELMLTSKSATEWNANCDKVKKANGGYPGFWYGTIILGGVMGAAQSTYKWS